MVLFGGHAWFCQFFGYNEIRSMSGRYASYWNAFLFGMCRPFTSVLSKIDGCAVFHAVRCFCVADTTELAG